MKVEFRDDKTLIVTPELSIDQVLLAKFEGGTISVEKPRPMEMNIERLVIRAPEKKE